MPDSIRVLYVDDERDLLEVGKLFLEESGEFSVTTIVSPNAALDLLQKEHFDAIVSDYQMDELDGIRFLQAARERFPIVPFILFTGRGREEVVIQALNNGADFYLQKGGDPDAQFAELAHKIRQAVRTKQAEQSLAENRDYLERIYTSVQGGILIIDAKTHEILDLNPAAEKMMGRTKDQIISRICHQFICPAEQGRCPITDLHQPVDNSERILLTADGKKRDIIKYVVPFNLHGRECLLETFLDNTERKQATDNLKAAYEKLTIAEEELRQNYEALSKKEQALRERETQLAETNTYLSSVISYAANPIVIWDVNSRITGFNKAFEKLTGFAESNVLGRDFDILFPDESRKSSLDLVCRALFGEKWEGVEVPVKTIHGATRTVIWNSANIYAEDGVTPLATVAMGTDITERKITEQELLARNKELHEAYDRVARAEEELRQNYEQVSATEEELRSNYEMLAHQEQALRESEEKFRTLVETSPDVIWEVDLEGTLRYVSPTVTSLTGYSPEEMVGKTIIGIVEEEARPRLMKEIERAISSDGPILPMQFPARHRDGDIFTVEIRVARLTGPGGKIAGFRGVAVDVTERRKTEDAIKASEEKFRALVESSLDGIAITDFSGILLFSNAAAGRIVDADDYPALIGKKNILEYIAPAHQPAVLRDFSQVMEGRDAYLVTYQLITEKGRMIWAECIGRKITFGKTPAMLVSFRDITERKNAEETLKDSEEFVNTIVENIPDMIFVKDAVDLRFVRFNRAGEELLGYSRENLYGKNDYDFFPKEEADFFTEKDREVLRSGTVVDIPEEVIQTKNKGERILHTKKIPVLDRDGNVRYLLGISEDITESRRADEILRESEKKFATVFQNNPVPLTLTSADGGMIADVNEAFLSSTGYLREEVIGKTARELGLFVNQDDITRLVTELRTKHQVSGMDISCRTKNGEIRICRFSSRVIMMGSTPHVISTVEDVSERLKTEEALQQANKKLHLLSSITRHDIKNQLITLDGYVSLLNKKRPAGCELEIARIHKVSKEITAMIQFTKDYQQVGIASPVWTDLRALVDAAEKGIAPGGVTVMNDIPAGTEVYADPLIAKVFFNLMDNAVRHGGSVKNIRFSLMTCNGETCITCEDDGNGVNPDMKKKLFRKGFGKNQGFGLFLSREVLDITGISIQETGEPGSGARFEMTVPKESVRTVAVQE
ncbi:PAS domain S-box protein [Methanoregula sp.]|uniref:PAS domain S-box protein n=1 Tax=Methanoregula sp. TaxID=2052170 RepID=UPI00261BD9D5|nr:PAS domain S-box protein [Methanoregula sp.]MDD5143061.1 PAS domain S-box protein [Methanoregula sp.]